MALGQFINSGMPLKQRGQGAVEAVLALPVFLILICIIFQLFFIAARAYSVNASDLAIMRNTVKKILSLSPGVSLQDTSFRVEIVEPDRNKSSRKNSNYQNEDRTLQVRVHWYYPIIIPFADAFLEKRKVVPVAGRHGINLHASWAMNMSGTFLEGRNNARY